MNPDVPNVYQYATQFSQLGSSLANWLRKPLPAEGVHPNAEAYRKVFLPELRLALDVTGKKQQ